MPGVADSVSPSVVCERSSRLVPLYCAVGATASSAPSGLPVTVTLGSTFVADCACAGSANARDAAPAAPQRILNMGFLHRLEHRRRASGTRRLAGGQ